MSVVENTILVISFLLIFNVAGSSATINLVRGVELKLQPFYSSNNDFTCIDGSKTIPFGSINDDYCDCVDGTDEPGTAACPEGKYYCYNLQHKAKYIPSSRVNDGICDCCDGSDEYDSSVACFNECAKHGKEAEEKKKESQAESMIGTNIRKQYVNIGHQKKAEKKVRIENINALLEGRRKQLENLKANKEAAEIPEKESKEKQEKIWADLEVIKREQEDHLERSEAFALLDVDKDGWISIQELLSHNNLDKDMDVTEAQKILGGETMVDAEGLVAVWKTLRPKYLKNGRIDTTKFDEGSEDGTSKPVSATAPTSVITDDAGETTDKKEDGDKVPEVESAAKIKIPDLPSEFAKHEKNLDHVENLVDDLDEDESIGDHLDAGHYSPEEDDDNMEEDEDDEPDKDETFKDELRYKDDAEENHGRDGESREHEEEKPEYNQETKLLIEVADKARSEYEAVDKILLELETEKKDIESYLDFDYGTEEEFSSLKDHCFEFTDREYTYKLCPFEKVSQRRKDGGSETDLGNQMTWEGSEGKSRYNIMKYSGGANCWNGPARSTVVRLSCGKENIVLSVSEPSRCEYEMAFKTPALCKSSDTTHDEL